MELGSGTTIPLPEVLVLYRSGRMRLESAWKSSIEASPVRDPVSDRPTRSLEECTQLRFAPLRTARRGSTGRVSQYRGFGGQHIIRWCCGAAILQYVSFVTKSGHPKSRTAKKAVTTCYTCRSPPPKNKTTRTEKHAQVPRSGNPIESFISTSTNSDHVQRVIQCLHAPTSLGNSFCYVPISF
ncbi:hypothetical protein LZ32DRAFT_264751 [Colletotrichum eremochloae]|nr:hypothetical protein LZ32DRAFT_264751 [Colletotrichum eremochloae]